jgi:hypothetical protein
MMKHDSNLCDTGHCSTQSDLLWCDLRCYDLTWYSLIVWQGVVESFDRLWWSVVGYGELFWNVVGCGRL